MQNPVPQIGQTIKLIRTQRGLSLDNVAALTGVSKAMLGQIERGASIPTVSTLWKIASGLHITFSKLMEAGTESYAPTPFSSITAVYEDSGKMELYNLFPFNPVSGFDYFYIIIKPGCNYISPGHPDVNQECLVVTQGSMVLGIEDEEFVMNTGDSIKFSGSAWHFYANRGESAASFQNIMLY